MMKNLLGGYTFIDMRSVETKTSHTISGLYAEVNKKIVETDKPLMIHNFVYNGEAINDTMITNVEEGESNAIILTIGTSYKLTIATNSSFTAEAFSAGGSLPIASANTLGGVKVGSGLSIAADGTLSAPVSVKHSLYMDWNEAQGRFDLDTTATSSANLEIANYKVGDTVSFNLRTAEESEMFTVYGVVDYVSLMEVQFTVGSHDSSDSTIPAGEHFAELGYGVYSGYLASAGFSFSGRLYVSVIKAPETPTEHTLYVNWNGSGSRFELDADDTATAETVISNYKVGDIISFVLRTAEGTPMAQLCATVLRKTSNYLNLATENVNTTGVSVPADEHFSLLGYTVYFINMGVNISDEFYATVIPKGLT